MAITKTSDEKTVIHGTPVVDGIAYAPAAWTRRPPLPPATAPELPEDKREAAVADFEAASKAVAEGLKARAATASGNAKEVLDMTAGLATDRGYLRMVKKGINAGTPPVQATMAATATFVEMFEKAGPLMAERTTDLRDVRDRIVARLQGLPEPGIPRLPYPVVVMGDDLSPADTAGMDPKDYVAIVTEGGGAVLDICQQLNGHPVLGSCGAAPSSNAFQTCLVFGNEFASFVSVCAKGDCAQRCVDEDVCTIRDLS